jgi:glycerophosphoryl diester phosphodiesterase
MPALVDLQGHRGARGLRPENTLAAFEAALDCCVSTVETDVHLTRDGTLILYHDAHVSEYLCRLAPGSTSPEPATRPLVSSLTLAQLRGYRADRNPDPRRFPDQDASVPSLAGRFAASRDIDPYAPLILEELFAFAAFYASEEGAQAGKDDGQRAAAARVRFNVEIKRVPFRPEYMGDAFDGSGPGQLEERLVEAVRAAGMVGRTAVCSFDHRCLRALKQMEPGLAAGALIANTAPASPAELVRQAGADVYGPDAEFLDAAQVRQVHDAGLRVVPWTVNDAEDWARLLDWGVDGFATDFPDRLAAWLRARGVAF